MKCDAILKESIAVVSDSGHDDYDADENEIEPFDWKAISRLHDSPKLLKLMHQVGPHLLYDSNPNPSMASRNKIRTFPSI